MYNTTINAKNLRNHNIALKTQEVINSCGFNSLGEKKKFKINLFGHNTGHSIEICENDIQDLSVKEKLTAKLEKELGRSVSWGSRHLYFGKKII